MTSPFAAAMIEARSSGSRISLPQEIPADRADAFAAQVETLHGLSLGVAGFKVGADGRTGEPSAAPLATATVFKNHTRIVTTEVQPLWLEAEVAMVVGRDLPCDGGLSEADVLDAMEGLAAAIEIVQPRIVEWPDIPKLAAMADFQANGGTVVSAVGRPATGLREEDLTVIFEMGDKRVEVAGKDYPGQDMKRLPTWLANHMSGWGPEMAARGLRKGDVIITGSWVGVIPAVAGETATVTVPGIGSCTVEVAAE